MDCKVTVITDNRKYNIDQNKIKITPNTSQVQGKVILVDESFVIFGKDGQKYNDHDDSCAATNNPEIVNQYKTLLEQLSKE